MKGGQGQGNIKKQIWIYLAAFCTISVGKSGHNSCKSELYSAIANRSARRNSCICRL